MISQQHHPHPPEMVRGHTVLEAEEARQAEKTGRLRYILGVSLSLAIVAMVIVYVAF